MHILKIQSFTGRNIYSHKPVIRMTVELEEFYNVLSKEIYGFNDRLLGIIPGLKKHGCSLGYEGGFVRRLEEGTLMGHVVEHVAIELQCMLGYDVYYGKTRLIREPATYYIVFEYANERCGMECGRSALNIVNNILRKNDINFESILSDLRKIAVESDMGPSTRAICDEAQKRGIPVSRLGDESLIQLGYGRYSRFIEASLTDYPSCVTVDIAGNKQLTKKMLGDYGIPVPYGDIAYTEDSAAAISREIGYPVVIKPFDANQGKGVALKLCSEQQVRSAYNEAAKFSRTVIVEKYIKGRDYRVLVVGDDVAAVSERKPPSVIGDGMHTVKELIDITNKSSLRGNDHEKPLTKIKLDNTAMMTLSRRGIGEDYIPMEGEVICLRDNGNLSTGGTAKNCTDEIHPFNRYLAVKAAKIIGLDIAGIDITAEDISVPISAGKGAVIEVNAAPGLRMHLFPTEGQPENVAADIVDMMFPGGRPHSIPIISITGTNGKTTTTRLIRHTLALTGRNVGMTSTSGIYIGNKCILKGDNTGPISAKIVLSNKEADIAVLETARGGIIKKGLGYDLADIGAIVNLSEDHLGLDGLNTLEDLAFVKSLVIEAVKPGGYAVLNADDELAYYLRERTRCNIIFFSKNKNNPLIANQMENGFKAVYVENGNVCIFNGTRDILLIGIKDIPITMGGIVGCNVENSLAAVAVLHSFNINDDIIRMGLKSFKPDLHTNPGRFNIFSLGNFSIMLDYGHNPAGYRAVIDVIRKLDAKRLVGIIGMPGDRLDRNIREVGEICGSVFSQIYIKEDNDLRGRDAGEVAGILFDSVIKHGARRENVEIIYSELKALETAILDAQPGDLIVMFYEEFEPAVEKIEKFKQCLDKELIQAEAAPEESVG